MLCCVRAGAGVLLHSRAGAAGVPRRAGAPGPPGPGRDAPAVPKRWQPPEGLAPSAARLRYSQPVLAGAPGGRTAARGRPRRGLSAEPAWLGWRSRGRRGRGSGGGTRPASGEAPGVVPSAGRPGRRAPGGAPPAPGVPWPRGGRRPGGRHRGDAPGGAQPPRRARAPHRAPPPSRSPRRPRRRSRPEPTPEPTGRPPPRRRTPRSPSRPRRRGLLRPPPRQRPRPRRRNRRRPSPHRCSGPGLADRRPEAHLPEPPPQRPAERVRPKGREPGRVLDHVQRLSGPEPERHAGGRAARGARTGRGQPGQGRLRGAGRDHVHGLRGARRHPAERGRAGGARRAPAPGELGRVEPTGRPALPAVHHRAAHRERPVRAPVPRREAGAPGAGHARRREGDGPVARPDGRPVRVRRHWPRPAGRRRGGPARQPPARRRGERELRGECRARPTAWPRRCRRAGG